MKKVISIFTALSLALGVCVGLVGCKKDEVTDTFTGVISEESYESVEAAAAAFLANEVGGGVLPTVFVSYEKTGDLSDKEISELNVTDAERNDLESAESGIAKYKEGSEAATAAEVDGGDSADGESEETYSQRLYVLIFKGNIYRYYVPQLAVGEMVTKSYYDSVMNVDNYKNCTMTVSGMSLNQDENYSEIYRATILYSETAFYSKEKDLIDGKSLETYYFEYDGKLYCAYQELNDDSNAPWEVEIEEYFDSVDEIRKYGLTQNTWSPFGSIVRYIGEEAVIDFTFFQKTEDGMKFVIPERYKNVTRRNPYFNYIDRVMERVKEVAIKVKDGRVVEKTTEWNYRISSEGITSVIYKFDSFGTTKVEIPQEIIDLIPKEE